MPYSEANKRTFQADVYICRVLVKAFRGKNLGQITPPMLEEFKQRFLKTPTVRGTKRSHSTVNAHLSCLSKIFSMAVDGEVIENNPCRKVRKMKLNNQRTRVLSYDEEERLFSALGNNELTQNIIIVALNTGMRRGEIFDLKWNDVDFQRKQILVQKSKTNKKRIIPMNETVSGLLMNLEQEADYVFPSPKSGKRLTDIKKGFLGAMKKARVKDFRFHDLRHTAASRMADAGADGFTLAAILGHSDIRMTARYTHATSSALRNAVAKLDFGNVLATKEKRQPLGSP